jgi:GT2 family glycosyltransferase
VKSINQFIPDPKPEIVVVADGHKNDYGFRREDYPDPFFVFSKAVNIGIRTLPDKDIILLNDDCILLEENFFERLHILATGGIPTMGILSPLVVGCVGNHLQRWHERKQYWPEGTTLQHVNRDQAVCFPCVHISRKMLNRIGLMDESIADYGRDDWKLCMNARRNGWKTSVTSLLRIQHGDGSEALGEGRGRSWSTSYVRRWRGGRPPSHQITDYLVRNGIAKGGR